MADVHVAILHPERRARRRTADAGDRRGARGPRRASRSRVPRCRARYAVVIAGPPDGRPFGARLRDVCGGDRRRAGLVVLGSGAMPLATPRDRRELVAAAAADRPRRPGQQPLLRPTSWRSPGPDDVLARAARPGDRQRAAALARGGGRDPGRATCAGGGGWASTSTGRSTSCCSAGAGRRRSAERRPTRVAHEARWPRPRASPRTARRARRRRPDVGRRRSPGWKRRDRVADPGTHRGTRAAHERRRASVRPRRCWGPCSSADGPASLGTHLARLGEAAVVDSAGPAGPSARRGRGRVARGRGPIRVRPAAPRADRRPVAAAR